MTVKEFKTALLARFGAIDAQHMAASSTLVINGSKKLSATTEESMGLHEAGIHRYCRVTILVSGGDHSKTSYLPGGSITFGWKAEEDKDDHFVRAADDEIIPSMTASANKKQGEAAAQES